MTLQTNIRDDLCRLGLTIQIFDQSCNTFYCRGLGRSMYMVRVCLNKAAFLFNCNISLHSVNENKPDVDLHCVINLVIVFEEWARMCTILGTFFAE